MESVHVERQMPNVSKLVQASATVVAHNYLSDTAVVAAEAKPSLRRQLKSAASKVANNVLVANQDDVLFGRTVAGLRRNRRIMSVFG